VAFAPVFMVFVWRHGFERQAEMSVIYDFLSPFGNATVSRRALVVDWGKDLWVFYLLAASLLVKVALSILLFKPHS